MPRSARWVFPLLLIFAAVIFLKGLNWGLPSRLADPFLFGERQPWDGQKILELAGGWDGNGAPGADMDANPLTGRDQPITLNATDAERAEIVRRYRLYSYQPDEMNTLKALARMHPGAGDLDPRLYQYGGLWFYPLGAMLKAAGLFHLIDLRSGPEGLAYYLDHPEAFGRFYIVARFYSVFWGLVGVWAIWRIAWRLTKSLAATAASVVCFVTLPIVVNMTHEAKPHLGGVVLCLLAALAAAKYVESGHRRWWMIAGALCGASLGMVLTMLPVFSILLVMALLRPEDNRKQQLRVLLASAAIGVGVYAIFNPYVILRLLTDRSVLFANLGNTASNMSVRPSFDGLKNIVWLVREGTSPLAAMLGFVGAIRATFYVIGRLRETRKVRQPPTGGIGMLIAAPAILIAIQAALFATDKPAEFGRFVLLPDIALALGAIWLLVKDEAGWNLPRLLRCPAVFVLVVFVCLSGSRYLRNFVRDSHPWTPRLAEATHLRTVVKERSLASPVIGIPAEPAPYDLPPVDLFAWKLVLLPRGYDDWKASAVADVTLEPTDRFLKSTGESSWEDIAVAADAEAPRTPISWAAKSFWIRGKKP